MPLQKEALSENTVVFFFATEVTLSGGVSGLCWFFYGDAKATNNLSKTF